MKRLHALVALACLFTPLTQAAEGPIWRAKTLPVEQMSLLAPYAVFNFFHSEGRRIRDRASEIFFNRKILDRSYAKMLFGVHGEKRKPNRDDSLPFYNNGKDLAEIAGSEFGYCLGFTFVVRRLNMLAFYEPDSPRLERIENYFPIIDRLVANQPAVVPGFRGLFEFASEPAIARHLKLHIVDQWARENVTSAGLGIYGKGIRPMGKAEVRRVRKDVRRKLELGVNPIVTFTLSEDYEERVIDAVLKKICEVKPEACEEARHEITAERTKGWRKIVEKRGGIHVVQVYAVDESDAETSRFKIWDINKPADEAAAEVFVKSSGEAFTVMKLKVFSSIDVEVKMDVTDLSVHARDTADLGRMLQGLRTFCRGRDCAASVR